SPDELAAGELPCHGAAGDVDDLEAFVGEELAGPHAAPPALANDVRRAVAAERVDAVGHLAERHVDRAGDMTLDVLVGLTHVDDARSSLELAGQIVDGHLGN